MEKIKHVLFRSWYILETLEDRIYHIILDVAVLVSVLSVLAGIVQKQPPLSLISTSFILLYLIIIQFITMRSPGYSHLCQFLFVLGLNCIFFPFHFFASGGIHSGMILFFLIGLVLCAILLRGKRRVIVFCLSIAVLESTVAISTFYPNLVQPMTAKQHVDDIMSTLLLAALALYSIIILILRSYEQERKHNEELMEKLRNLSIMDALSGLYNRRELFRRLEVMYDDTEKERSETLNRMDHYIAMFDVDNFKKLNDTYGHSFGDSVLVSLSNVLREMIHPESGELTARYGGEEFVSILAARSPEEAFERVDAARERISGLHWPDHSSLTVTISGGLIACADHPDLTMAMHDVDELLYKAKAAGKNRICLS